MYFHLTTALAVVASLVNAAAIPGPAIDIEARNNCGPEFTGELILYHVEIYEYPVVINTYIESNTVLIIEENVTIDVNNAPISFISTVSVTTTSTVTSTLSTATVTATAAVQTVTVAAGTKSTAFGASGASGAAVKSETSAVAIAGSATSKTAVKTSTVGADVGSSTDSTTYAVAGGSAAGQGLNTALNTASTTYSTEHTASAGVYTYHNASTTYTSTSSATATSLSTGEFTDWTVFVGNGANLGNWFEIEYSNDEYFWDLYAPNASDEWTFCEYLGKACGTILTDHYGTYITTESIDKLASVGVDTLRIPTTYAAWIEVPGSQLYHGDQQNYLKNIVDYAVNTYGMRTIIGLHSLPGGVNDLDIGEAFGHDAWFYNQTNLDYSYQAVEEILDFIVASGNEWAFTIAPINEASDNIAGFATAAGMTQNGTNYVVEYIHGVLERIEKVDARIPVMLQDCFLGEEHWAPYFANGTNLVIDTHIYYFAASGIYSEYVNDAVCGQAAAAPGDGKFPVFVGEWSLQVLYNNSFDARETIFNTQRYAWGHYAHGGSFWSANFNGTAAVDGEGVQRDYWDYLGLIDAGVIKSPVANASYC